MQTNNLAVKANTFFQKIVMAVMALMVSVVSFAQETKKVDIDINTDKGGGNFFASPWVWVVGGAVCILLLVALLRGGGSNKSTASRTDRVTVTKTTDRDVT